MPFDLVNEPMVFQYDCLSNEQFIEKGCGVRMGRRLKEALATKPVFTQ